MQEQDNNTSQQNDDLFQYQSPVQPAEPVTEENTAETASPVPEDLPSQENTIPRQNTPENITAPAAIRAPLLFSDRAPIPTRDGEVEQEPGYNRKHTATEKEKAFTPLSPAEIPDGASLGQVLVMARQKSGYSVEQVCEITRIAQRYITALETDELTVVPPGIFGPAYIRSISKCYRLPDSIVQAVLASYAKEHKAKREELSAEFMKSLNPVTTPVNEAEEKRLTYIFYGILSTVAVVIILGLWALISVLVNVFSTSAEDLKQDTAATQKEQAPIVFEQEQFRKLIPTPIEGKHVLLPDAKPQIRNH